LHIGARPFGILHGRLYTHKYPRENFVKNQLKKFCAEAGKTQEEIAHAVGVTQTKLLSLGGWPSCNSGGQLDKLARVFKTTPDHLLGRHPPIEAAFYDESAPDELQYYGEVTVHFLGGGESLLLSISEDAYSHLYRDLQRNLKFVAVQGLSNQTVIIRSKAISDLYFSSEAYDDFGPHKYREIYLKQYKRSPQLPDARDWDIIESLCHDVGIEDFDETARRDNQLER
jgi:transcriptional regulator with XRE-family HTH domain